MDANEFLKKKKKNEFVKQKKDKLFDSLNFISFFIYLNQIVWSNIICSKEIIYRLIDSPITKIFNSCSSTSDVSSTNLASHHHHLHSDAPAALGSRRGFGKAAAAAGRQSRFLRVSLVLWMSSHLLSTSGTRATSAVLAPHNSVFFNNPEFNNNFHFVEW